MHKYIVFIFNKWVIVNIMRMRRAQAKMSYGRLEKESCWEQFFPAADDLGEEEFEKYRINTTSGNDCHYICYIHMGIHRIQFFSEKIKNEDRGARRRSAVCFLEKIN